MNLFVNISRKEDICVSVMWMMVQLVNCSWDERKYIKVGASFQIIMILRGYRFLGISKIYDLHTEAPI
jgi:hypothetical protein